MLLPARGLVFSAVVFGITKQSHAQPHTCTRTLLYGFAALLNYVILGQITSFED